MQTPAQKNTEAPFILGTVIHDAQSGNELPADWTGVARWDRDGRTTYFYIGDENNERTWNGLLANNYAMALNEAEQKFGKAESIAEAIRPTAHIPQIQAYEAAISILESGQMPEIQLKPDGRFNDIVFNGHSLAMWDDKSINKDELLTVLKNNQASYLERFGELDLDNATPGASMRSPITGKVIDVSADYIVQHIGMGKRVYHVIDDLEITPTSGRYGRLICKNDHLEIRYDENGKGIVKDLDREHEQLINNVSR